MDREREKFSLVLPTLILVEKGLINPLDKGCLHNFFRETLVKQTSEIGGHIYVVP